MSNELGSLTVFSGPVARIWQGELRGCAAPVSVGREGMFALMEDSWSAPLPHAGSTWLTGAIDQLLTEVPMGGVGGGAGREGRGHEGEHFPAMSDKVGRPRMDQLHGCGERHKERMRERDRKKRE